MKVLQSLFPIMILLLGSLYGYQKYDQLPESATIGITYLTHMLALIVAGLSIRFSRSSLFFYILLVVITNLVLRFGWAGDELGYGLLSAFVPLLLVVLTLLPDRGIISVKAIPAYAILLLVSVLPTVVVMTSPAWTTQLVLSDWLPPQYFDWTSQSQSVLIVSFAALYVMLTLSILNPSLHVSAGFGVLFMLVIQLHFGDRGGSLNVFTSAALLMCLYAIMQETWRMAYIDELTGLPGRRALREKFQKISGSYTVAMVAHDRVENDPGNGWWPALSLRRRRVFHRIYRQGVARIGAPPRSSARRDCEQALYHPANRPQSQRQSHRTRRKQFRPGYRLHRLCGFDRQGIHALGHTETSRPGSLSRQGQRS
jgi:hypothetical protein